MLGRRVRRLHLVHRVARIVHFKPKHRPASSEDYEHERLAIVLHVQDDVRDEFGDD